MNAGVWDGEYSELIRLLAPFQDAQIQSKLLPGLKRVENAVSVGTALVMSAADVAREAKQKLSLVTLQEAILSRACEEYALAPITDRIRDSARQISEAILSVPVERWHLTAGPVLVPRGAQTKPTIEGPLPLSLDGEALVLIVF